MAKYQAALTCPNCKVVNVLPIVGGRKEFMKGEGTLNTKCFDCGKQISCKVKDVGYFRVE